MKTTTRWAGAVALLAAAALALSGCSTYSSDDTDSASTTYQDAIHFQVSASIPTLDPQISPSGVVTNIDSHIYETLVAFDEKSVPQPLIASSWTTSDDGKVWTFTLRDGITFHDGQALTATDVVSSLNRWKSVTARAKTLLGDSLFVETDPATVTLTLASPHGDVLEQLANPLQMAAIMPARIADVAPTTGVTEYIGTGPYKFVEWKQDQSVQVTRFDDYSGVDTEPSGYAGRKDAPTKDLYFDFVLDSATRQASFVSGDTDFNTGVSVDNLPQVEALPDVNVEKQVSSNYLVVFNMKSPIFKELAAREAVAASINADDFMTAVVGDPDLYRLNPSYVYTENSTWWSDAGSEGVYNENDTDAAEKKLAESGYDGETVHILTSHDYGEVYYNSAVILQSQLEAVGFTTSLDVYDYATLIQNRNTLSGWDIYAGAFAAQSTPSQLLYLTPNYGGADDPQLASLLAGAAAAVGVDAQQDASAALEEYLWKYLPVINVGDSYSNTATRDTVDGLQWYNSFPVLWNTRVAAN